MRPHAARDGLLGPRCGGGVKDYHRPAMDRNDISMPPASAPKIKEMQVPIYHVDAFSDEPFLGNPAAVCLLSSWLDDNSLRKVAAENNLSATAFLVLQNEDYHLRWFSPRCEIRLCGHATLATAHILCNVLQLGLKAVTFCTKFGGSLIVHKHAGMLSMNFPLLLPKPFLNVPPELGPALGVPITPSKVLEANDTLIAVFDSARAIQNIVPDFALLERLHPYSVVATARGETSDFVSRYFAPSYGVPEDPVTGSAHCALAPYWAGILNKARLHARQLSKRGGELWCQIDGDHVTLDGKAKLTLTGTLTI
jgi:PhzF family phenazine biosynthesis protein